MASSGVGHEAIGGSDEEDPTAIARPTERGFNLGDYTTIARPTEHGLDPGDHTTIARPTEHGLDPGDHTIIARPTELGLDPGDHTAIARPTELGLDPGDHTTIARPTERGCCPGDHTTIARPIKRECYTGDHTTIARPTEHGLDPGETTAIARPTEHGLDPGDHTAIVRPTEHGLDPGDHTAIARPTEHGLDPGDHTTIAKPIKRGCCPGDHMTIARPIKRVCYTGDHTTFAKPTEHGLDPGDTTAIARPPEHGLDPGDTTTIARPPEHGLDLGDHTTIARPTEHGLDPGDHTAIAPGCQPFVSRPRRGGPTTGIIVANSKYVNISTGQMVPGTVGEDTLELHLIEAKKMFVETEIYRTMKRKVKQFGHVTIYGASGEGKTTMALMLSLRYRNRGYQVVFVDSIEKFDLDSCLSSTPRVFLIIDDLFGTVGLSTNVPLIKSFLNDLILHIDHCIQSREQIQSVLQDEGKSSHDDKRESQTKDIRVIFTSKSYNFHDGLAQLYFSCFPLFGEQTVMNITLHDVHCLSQAEKQEIYERHKSMLDECSKANLPEYRDLKMHSNIFGFPLICKLCTFSKNIRKLFEETCLI